MAQKHTLEELNNCSREELITIVLMMQGQLDALNDNIEKLIEQVRIANNYRFGRHTESLKSIEGQLSFFDEADAAYDESSREPSAEEVITAKRAKKKGQRNIDLKDFPEEILPPYSVSEEQLDAFYQYQLPAQLPAQLHQTDLTGLPHLSSFHLMCRTVSL